MIDQAYRQDVDASITYWKQLLNEEMDGIEYAYVKGSCIKPWQSMIDYVPFISDVDIHLKFREGRRLNDYLGRDPAIQALNIASKYESEFQEFHPDAKHTPRIQLIVLTEDREFIPPIRKQIQVMIGDPQFPVFPDPSFVRQRDRDNLREMKSYLQTSLVDTVLDRIGIEFWSALRRLTWRIAPTPVRLLTQVLDDHPKEIWTWNRTTIVEKLTHLGITRVADHYRAFYQNGWNLFHSDLEDISMMKAMIKDAYYCIKYAIEELEELEELEDLDSER